jgi:hypothetical protein
LGLVAGLAALVCFLVSASAAQAELVFKRPTGSVMHFSGTPSVWCGPWEILNAPRRSIHVQLRGPRRGWEVSAVQAEAKAGHRIRFPSDITFKQPHGALLFAYQAKPLIEASTNEEEASGSMVFSQASCEIGMTVAFTVHAVLGSELFEGAKVRVNGTFSGTVGEPPQGRTHIEIRG